MKKLAFGSNVVLVSLTTNEFKLLAGKTHSNVPDGTNVSLASVKNKLDLINDKRAELLELKNLTINVTDKLNTIGI